MQTVADATEHISKDLGMVSFQSQAMLQSENIISSILQMAKPRLKELK